MTAAMPFELAWRRREPPLAPVAVAGSGAVAAALATRARERVARGAELLGAAGSGWLVILGGGDDLPWADGAVYLGADDGLLVPTTLAVWPAAGLVRAALRDHAPRGSDLLVLMPDLLLAAPEPARPVTADTLIGLAGDAR